MTGFQATKYDVFVILGDAALDAVWLTGRGLETAAILAPQHVDITRSHDSGRTFGGPAALIFTQAKASLCAKVSRQLVGPALG